MSLVFGVDPGFASLGIAVFDISTNMVLRLGVIRTEKSDKKRRVLASDDNLRRAREIHGAIVDVLTASIKGVIVGSFVAICAESMSFPRNAANAAKVAMSWGVLASIAETMGLPIVQASPQEIKKKLCGQKDASKDDVEQTLRHHYPHAKVDAGVPRSLHEHAWDALSAIYGCLDSDVIRTARRIGANAV